MRIFDLTLKDLLQIMRDRRSLLFLVAMPILFTLFMGFAYNSGQKDNSTTDKRLTLGWINHDPNGPLAVRLIEQLAKSDAIKLSELTADALEADVREGKVAGALIIPADYSAEISAGRTPQLTLIANTRSPQGQSVFQVVRVVITQLLSSVEIARLSTKAVGNPADFQPAFTAAAQAWAETDNTAFVKVELAVAETSQMWYGDNPYNQASPGILVQFAIFGLVSSGQILVQERKTRTLQRMMTTSMRAWEIVAGHSLAMFVIVCSQELLLVVFGQVVLGVNYAREPLGIFAVSIGLALWIAALGLLIGVLAKDDSQVVLFSLLAMFVFSAMGGTWFPLEASSGTFAAIGKLLPSAWAMTAYQNILIRGLSLESVWGPTLSLMAYALVFFALAVWRFRQLEA